MKKEVRAKWVAALRSGEYKQAIGYLKTESGFCCLGVLCDLAEKEGIAKSSVQTVNKEERYQRQVFVYDEKACKNLPLSVMDWAGLERSSPHVLIGATVHSLESLNDSGSKFEYIAEIIECQKDSWIGVATR